MKNNKILKLNNSYANNILMSTDPPVYNWNRIVLKPVRSKDNQDVGNVISIEDDTFTVHSVAMSLLYQKMM
jgi:hypothetical protein